MFPPLYRCLISCRHRGGPGHCPNPLLALTMQTGAPGAAPVQRSLTCCSMASRRMFAGMIGRRWTAILFLGRGAGSASPMTAVATCFWIAGGIGALVVPPEWGIEPVLVLIAVLGAPAAGNPGGLATLRSRAPA